MRKNVIIYDKLHLLPCGTENGNLFIMGIPLNKAETYTGVFGVKKGKSISVYVYTRELDNYTKVQEYAGEDTDNDGLIAIENINIEKGQYLGFKGILSRVISKGDSLNDTDYTQVTDGRVDNITHSIFPGGSRDFIFKLQVKTESEMNLLSKAVNRNYPYPVNSNKIDGVEFFRVHVYQECSNTSSVSDNDSDSKTIVSSNCVIRFPKTYSEVGKPTKVVFFAHGAGGVIGTNTSGTAGFFNRIEKLIEAGYACFDVNGVSSNNNLGSHKTCQAVAHAFDYIREHYNVEDKLYIHGGSMGGLTAYNFCQTYPYMVRCCNLWFPVTHLKEQVFDHPWDTAIPKRLANEYEFSDQTGNTYEADKVVGYDPINSKSFVFSGNRYNYFPVPLRITHGKNDNVVSYEGSVELVSALKRAGNYVEFRTVDEMGHEVKDFLLQEEVTFFNRW